MIFKPSLGQPKSVRLSDRVGIDLVSTRATLTLKSRQGNVTVRFAEHFHPLWGALILLSEFPVPQQLGAPQVQYRASAATVKFAGRGTR